MLNIIGFLLVASSALQPQYAYAEVKPASFPIAETATTTLAIKSLISHYSELQGVSESDMWRVIKCENPDLDPSLQSRVLSKSGPNGREDSWGLSQIHLSAHKDITKAQATDAEWSIRWMAEQFKKGNQAIWSCW